MKTMHLDKDTFHRCCAALARHSNRNGFIYDQPSEAASEFDPKTGIVTLYNSYRILGRFKVGKTRITRLKD